MSHSAVFVIGPADDEALAAALAPFDENVSVPRYKDRISPAPPGWEIGRAHSAEFRRLLDEGVERRDAWAAVWGERNDDPRLAWPLPAAADDGVDPTDLLAVLAWHRARYGDDDLNLDDEGLYTWSTYNPQSRWDWYSVGGRWSGMLLLRPDAEALPNAVGEQSWPNEDEVPKPGRVDRARWGTIDWERLAFERVEERRKAWAEAQGAPETQREMRWDVRPGETEEAYVRRGVRFSTFAVLTPEGEWIERGKMGWWGVVSGDTDDGVWADQWTAITDRYCENETIVTVVDVHI